MSALPVEHAKIRNPPHPLHSKTKPELQRVLHTITPEQTEGLLLPQTMSSSLLLLYGARVCALSKALELEQAE